MYKHLQLHTQVYRYININIYSCNSASAMKLITYMTFIQKLAYASLPTQQKSTLLSRVSTHTSADCEISGRQPTRLEKEFPRIHNALHSKKNDAQV